MDMEKEVTDLKIAQAETSSSTKSAHHRIDGLEEEIKDIRRLTVAVEKIADKTDNIENKVDKVDKKMDSQDDRIKQIEMKPVKRWNDTVDTIIKLVIGGIIAYLLTRIGLKG